MLPGSAKVTKSFSPSSALLPLILTSPISPAAISRGAAADGASSQGGRAADPADVLISVASRKLLVICTAHARTTMSQGSGLSVAGAGPGQRSPQSRCADDADRPAPRNPAQPRRGRDRDDRVVQTAPNAQGVRVEQASSSVARVSRVAASRSACAFQDRPAPMSLCSPSRCRDDAVLQPSPRSRPLQTVQGTTGMLARQQPTWPKTSKTARRSEVRWQSVGTRSYFTARRLRKSRSI